MLNLLSEQQFMHKAQEGIATKGKWPWKKNNFQIASDNDMAKHKYYKISHK